MLRRIAPIPEIRKNKERENFNEIKEDYSKKYKIIAIIWSFIGGSATIVWFIILALLNQIIWIWFMAIVVNNGLIALFGFLQKKYSVKYESKLENW